jgi:hypothetical protein
MMLRLFPPGTRGKKSWLAYGRRNGVLIERVTGCATEEEAKVWLDEFLTKPPPRRRARVIARGYPLAGRTAGEYREAEKLKECLSTFIGELAALNLERARRGISSLNTVANQVTNAERRLSQLRAALEIDP